MPNEPPMSPQSPLLITESADDFNRMAQAFGRDLQPRGVIGKLYLKEFIELNWQVEGLRRCKTSLINAAMRRALEKLLLRVAQEPSDLESLSRIKVFKELAYNWFSSPQAKAEVKVLLEEVGLDESVIEAEAMRDCAKELEIFDRMLASLEARRNKTLRLLGEFYDGFSVAKENKNKGRNGQIIDHETIPAPASAATDTKLKHD